MTINYVSCIILVNAKAQDIFETLCIQTECLFVWNLVAILSNIKIPVRRESILLNGI